MVKTSKRFGLLGRNIDYSFSRTYFTEKFKNMGLQHVDYVNYDLKDISEFKKVVLKDRSILKGLNVTIPYKEEIIPLLDEIDEEAEAIGAVNTVKFLENGSLKGFNTDAYGFEQSLRACWRGDEQGALILGTGGASKAVAYVLHKMGLRYLFVSRSKRSDSTLSYKDLTQNILEQHELIVNCSPLGTFPDIEAKPDVPYEYLTNSHFLYDLIYNPEKTAFLKMGEKAGAIICNGKSMLVQQAEKSWEIWNSRSGIDHATK